MFIVSDHWIDGYGLLKPEAICILRVFFGTKTNKEADRELEIRKNNPKKGFYRFTALKGDDAIEI